MSVSQLLPTVSVLVRIGLGMNRSNTIEMNSEVFESRQDDFKTIVIDIRRKIEHNLPQSSGGGFYFIYNL